MVDANLSPAALVACCKSMKLPVHSSTCFPLCRICMGLSVLESTPECLGNFANFDVFCGENM